MNTYNCPVCNHAAALYDVVDFNKNCEEHRGFFLPLSGQAVYYARCTSCSYTFAPEFMSWTDQDFIDKIYNEDYILVDPDYVENRHFQNAALLNGFFGPYRMHFRHLDYGGGNGVLSEILQRAQWDSTSYDPFPHNDHQLGDLGTYSFITAFEVFEHVPDPQLMMRNFNSLLAGTDALIFFSTGVSDGLINEKERLNWWYVAPRNGHIGIHTTKSLKALGERNNFNFVSLGPSFHVYFRSFPAWAKDLIQQ
jgi:hypothetical protein